MIPAFGLALIIFGGSALCAICASRISIVLGTLVSLAIYAAAVAIGRSLGWLPAIEAWAVMAAVSGFVLSLKPPGAKYTATSLIAAFVASLGVWPMVFPGIRLPRTVTRVRDEKATATATSDATGVAPGTANDDDEPAPKAPPMTPCLRKVSGIASVSIDVLGSGVVVLSRNGDAGTGRASGPGLTAFWNDAGIVRFEFDFKGDEVRLLGVRSGTNWLLIGEGRLDALGREGWYAVAAGLASLYDGEVTAFERDLAFCQTPSPAT